MRAGLGELQAACDAADGEGYFLALDRLGQVSAKATHNRIYLLLAGWHAQIVADLEVLFREVRRPTPQHLQGITLLFDLIRARDAEGAVALVSAYHAWATPRLLELARASGEPRQDPGEERPCSTHR